MLRFEMVGIPVMIQAWFWLGSFLISGGLGMRAVGDWPQVFAGMMAVLVSILWHEMGHALAARGLGLRAAVMLHALGGMTLHQGRELSRRQSAWVVAAGPLASLVLAGIFYGAWAWGAGRVSPVLADMVEFGLWINVVWTGINLLPVMPLDGGQLLREVLGPRRFRWTCWVGGATAVLGAVAALLLTKFILLPVLLGCLAWANFRGARDMAGGVGRQ